MCVWAGWIWWMCVSVATNDLIVEVCYIMTSDW